MNASVLRYETDLPIPNCIAAISGEPWVFGEVLDPLWYSCDAATQTAVLVTFRGGKFRKARKTRYRISFSRQHGRTIAVLEFLEELCGLPAMTPVSELDQFMKHTIRAVPMV